LSAITQKRETVSAIIQKRETVSGANPPPTKIIKTNRTSGKLTQTTIHTQIHTHTPLSLLGVQTVLHCAAAAAAAKAAVPPIAAADE
jgi:hypothetical protein